VQSTLTIIITALLESVSAHFFFVDIKSQIACNFYAKDVINLLSMAIMEGHHFLSGGCMGRSVAGTEQNI
jgi:hypothetical protein